MFDSFARQFKPGDATSCEKEYSPSGIEKHVSHRLWSEAKTMATDTEGRIDVHHAMVLFDELVLHERERLQAERKLNVVCMPATGARDGDPSAGTAAPAPHVTEPILQHAALCNACGMPAGEGRAVCPQCESTARVVSLAPTGTLATGITADSAVNSSSKSDTPGFRTAGAVQRPQSQRPPQPRFFDFETDRTDSAGDNQQDYPFRDIYRAQPLEPRANTSRRLQLVIGIAVLALLAGLFWKYVAPQTIALLNGVHEDAANTSGAAGPTAGDKQKKVISSRAARHSSAKREPSKDVGISSTQTADASGTDISFQKPAGDEMRSHSRFSGVVAQDAGGSSVSLRAAQPKPTIPPAQIAPKEAAALLIREVVPTYPPQAQALGIRGGHVTLEVTVDNAGRVVAADPISGDISLVDSAMAAVKQWRYRPLFNDGQPLSFKTTVVVDFSLASRAR